MRESNDHTGDVPVKCQVCGRQDETVRYVSYPFVFSFVVLTFQRAFTGCWCRFHRIQRWFAASFITSIFGWLGIPFGIALTPVRLLQLARGGLQDNALNGQILHLIGEQKLQNGDSQGAIRCFEASLLYMDDDGVSEQLKTLYRSQASTGDSTISGVYSLFLFPMVSVGFAIIGLVVGVLDYIVRWFSSFLHQELSIFILILLQVPFVILVYFCGALLSYVFQLVVRLTRVGSTVFLSIASLVTSLFFINGIVSGSTYGIYFNYFNNGVREIPNEIPVTLIAILTRGIPYIFSPSSFASNFSGNALFAALLSLSFLLFILTLMPKIKMLAFQQERIARLQNLESSFGPSFPIFGLVGLFGLVLGFAFLFVYIPQNGSVDALEAFDHTGIGYNYQNSSQPERAIAEYQMAIELKPNFAIAHILLGNTYLSLGRADDAYETFITASTLEPYNPVPYNGIGWAYFQLGEYDLAEDEFLRALQLDDQYLEAHLGMGLVYLNQFRIEESRKELQGVIDIAPDIPDAHLGFGVLYFITGDYDDAIKSFDTTLKLNPNFIDAYVFNGIIHYRQDRYTEAEDAFNSALKIIPGYCGAFSGIGDIRVTVNDFEGGMDYYDKAIASCPDRVDAYLNKAGVLKQVDRLDEAISLLEPFLEKDERVGPVLSYLYYLKGDEANGERFLQGAISFTDSLSGIKKGRGYLAISAVEASLTDFDKAKYYAGLAEKNYPVVFDSDTYFYLAQLYSSMGDQVSAENMIRKGGEVGHSEISLHLAKAELAISQEKLDEAEMELQAALRIDNSSANAHATLSFVLYQNDSLPRASLEARTALRLNPYNAYAHTQLAYIYFTQGNTRVALDEAQEAVRLNRLDDTPHYILGVCYMETGNNEGAISEFEQFLDLYWDRAYVREYKAKAEEYLAQLKQSK